MYSAVCTVRPPSLIYIAPSIVNMIEPERKQYAAFVPADLVQENMLGAEEGADLSESPGAVLGSVTIRPGGEGGGGRRRRSAKTEKTAWRGGRKEN